MSWNGQKQTGQNDNKQQWCAFFHLPIPALYDDNRCAMNSFTSGRKTTVRTWHAQSVWLVTLDPLITSVYARPLPAEVNPQ